MITNKNVSLIDLIDLYNEVSRSQLSVIDYFGIELELMDGSNFDKVISLYLCAFRQVRTNTLN